MKTTKTMRSPTSPRFVWTATPKHNLLEDSIGNSMPIRSSCAESVQQGNVFSAAYYLKELCETGITAGLFREAYREFHSKGDLWWQVRCLQELGWQSELKELLVSNREAIEKEGNTSLLQYLCAATGEQEKLYQQMKLEAEYSLPE